MSDERFTTKGIIISNYGVWDIDDKSYANDEVAELLNEQQARIKELEEENEQLKYINNQIDEELIDDEMTNMECLLLLIPFGLLFVLLAMIIIVFLVQLGWVVI